jgi:hypothetical protein
MEGSVFEVSIPHTISYLFVILMRPLGILKILSKSIASESILHDKINNINFIL